MSGISRRQMLKVSSGLGVAGLAGCVDTLAGGGGGGGGSSTSLSVGVPSGSSTTGQASQAFQRVVSSQLKDVQWTTQETGGDPASLRQYDQGNLDALSAGNFIVSQAAQDKEPFAKRPIDKLPYQGFMVATLHLHWLAVDGSGIETTDDLVGKKVWPLPPSWGLRQMTETVLQNAGLWEKLKPTVVDVDTGDIAGAIEENRVDAIVAYGSNFVNLPGWATEVDARAKLHAVEMTESFKQGVDATGGTNYKAVDTYGWEQDVGTDKLDTWPSAFQFHFAHDVPTNVAYKLAKLSNEHYKQVREGQPSYLDHSKLKNMTGGYLPDIPVHPGVAKFLEENGAWSDEWTRGKAE